jgi:hypothetical protein
MSEVQVFNPEAAALELLPAPTDLVNQIVDSNITVLPSQAVTKVKSTKVSAKNAQKDAEWKERNLRGLRNAIDGAGIMMVLERSATN